MASFPNRERSVFLQNKTPLSQIKRRLRIILKFAKDILQQMKPLHYVALILVVSLGVFNGITGAYPYIKQHQREGNIVKTFDTWWHNAGAREFRSVGLEPTKELKAEEFQRYREKYLQQNPSYIVEERVAGMKKEYREWWENNGGREAYIQDHGHYPNESDYRASLEEWINSFTDRYLRYSLAFAPKYEQYERVLTSWILIPGVCSFLSFAGLFMFAIVRLARRWSLWIICLTTAAVTLVGPILVSVLTTTSFFDHYSTERYMGMSLTVAFLLGATAFGNRKNQVTPLTRNICFSGVILDMAINWFLNPGIFGAVAALSPVCFGIGAFAGVRIETRLRSQAEINADLLRERLLEKASQNPMAERKAKTRTLIEDGFTSAKNCRPEQAHQQLRLALTQLLQEHPVDAALVKQTVIRMTAPDQYLDFSSNQWMEWGEIAKAKNAPDAAILLLKKCLSKEKDPNFARRSLFTLGETCVTNKIEVQEGIGYLQKVIEMNENDILAKQARKTLEALK